MCVFTESSDPTTTTTGIVVIVVVCCVVLTSLVWVLIIHQTRKRTQAAAGLTSPPAYPRDEGGLTRYPAPPRHGLPHHHLTSELMHNMTPLLGGTGEGYPGAQDSGSEHSSGKDSGTGDSAQRSNEDLVPLELSRPGLRRSLIICGDSRGSPVMRGESLLLSPPLPPPHIHIVVVFNLFFYLTQIIIIVVMI